MTDAEYDLKALLLESISPDFEVNSEVRGINLIDGSVVIIDFLARAKEHITGDGFTNEWFGIEVKYIPPDLEEKKVKQAVWQSITYAQSVYNEIRPPFVFLSTNVFNVDDDYHRHAIRGIFSLAQYGNVGRLHACSDGYGFKFDQSLYYRRDYEGSKKGVSNAGQIRYTGNFQTVKARCKRNRING